MDDKLLGKNLRFLRLRENFTQAEMPTRCGISGATWSNYEIGNTEPSLSNILKISRLFRVSIDDLLTLDLEKGKPTDEIEVSIISQKGKANSKVIGKLNTSENALNAPFEANESGIWTLIKLIQNMDGKLDGIRVLIEKGPKKRP